MGYLSRTIVADVFRSSNVCALRHIVLRLSRIYYAKFAGETAIRELAIEITGRAGGRTARRRSCRKRKRIKLNFARTPDYWRAVETGMSTRITDSEISFRNFV